MEEAPVAKRAARRGRPPASAYGKTAVERPVMRAELREDDPRAAAERRAAEIMGHLDGSLDEGRDEFSVDKSRIPDGWTYEWKRKLLVNQEDPSYQVALARTGWEPVPAARHPEMMPAGSKSASIERKGMTLMMRPEIITEKVKEIDRRNARDQVRIKEQQLNSAPDGQLPRYADPRTRANIKKGYEAMPVPQD